MALKLNNIIIPFEEFSQDATQTPRYLDAMPALLLAGRMPLSVAGIYDQRVTSDMPDWEDNYFDTSDFFGYADIKNADEMKFVLTVDNKRNITENGRKILEKITSETMPINRALDATGLYAQVEGIPLSRSELEKYGLEKDLSKQEVLDHPLWRTVLRHPDAVPKEFAYDKGFMQQVVDHTFSEMESRFHYDKGMGIYLASPEKVPTFRPAYVDRLVYWSRLSGRRILDNDNCRLVGVAPEALSAPGKVIVKPSLETTLNVVNEHLGKSRIALRIN